MFFYTPAKTLTAADGTELATDHLQTFHFRYGGGRVDFLV
jgi:hypothetical protein